MQPFIKHTGIAAPLLRDNIDTDAIIPSREMKTVSKLGLGVGLFAPWRYLDEQARTLNPDFVLNKSAYANASILLTGKNFGCGSSREHAVWALKDFGIRCIIASSFGSIFSRNCVRNGILTIELAREQIKELSDYVNQDPPNNQLEIDLESKIMSANDQTIDFDIVSTDRRMLLEGLDQIAVTQKFGKEIDLFQQLDRKLRPWIYN